MSIIPDFGAGAYGITLLYTGLRRYDGQGQI